MNISPLKEAWRSMYQARSCPPFSVTNDPEHADNVAEHRKGCPICALRADHDIDVDAWAEMGRSMIQDWPKPSRPEILPGQVWILTEAKGGWDERFRYINPPLVLVLEVFEDVKGVRVAQIFDHHELAADGDMALDEGLGIAEAWNTYALDQADLDLCFGQVADETLSAVRQAQDSGQDDLDERSTLWFFRQLELEVSAFMAMEAMGRLMMRHERNIVREIFADVNSTRAKVLAFDQTIKLPDAEDGLRMLALAELPAQRLAASGSKNQLPFIIVTVGRETNPCRSALADIKHARLEDSIIRVTGTLPVDARNGLLVAWWRRSDTGMDEGEVRFDPASGMFRAAFFGKGNADFELGELKLLLVIMDHE